MRTRKILSLILAVLTVVASVVVTVPVMAEDELGELAGADAYAATITYKIKVDGVEVTVGSYSSGTKVKLPAATAPEGKVFVGYKKTDGTVITEAAVTTDVIEYTSVFRNAPKGDYINERGNLANLKAKLEAGKLNVVFLGGSVTAGAGATGRGRWASQVIDYLRSEYPQAQINEFNEGIGGTGSRLGSFRLADDVIAHDPDLVFVEFMLNDAYNSDYSGGTYRAGKNYEYILRNIREQAPDAEIITLFIANGSTAKTYGYSTVHPIGIEQDMIAANYDVTSIDIGRYMLESIFDEDKQYDEDIWQTYVTDTVHPGNLGYTIYAELINSYLDGIKTATGEAKEYTVPETYAYPATEGYYTVTIPLTLDGTTINPALKNVNGFTLAGNNTSPTYNYKLVPASEASFEFEFSGTELSFYMNSPNKGSLVKVTVDGVTKTQDGQDDTNGPKEFFSKLKNTTHTAKIELSGITKDGNVLGILVGVDSIEPEPVDPSEIDCIIKTAEDIVADGNIPSVHDNPTNANSKITAGKVELKGLVDGMARFGVKSANIGQNASTGDRLVVKINDLVFSEYPYCVIVYKTNIDAGKLNFNMTTKDTVPASNGDYKQFFSQSRVVGSLATGIAAMKSDFAAEGKITGVYVPIYSTTTPVMTADDYFDVQYIGFFKNSDDADAFDYEKYLEYINTPEDPGDTPDDPGDDPTGDPTDVPGDVNGDGQVTRPDLIRLTQYFANWDVVIDEYGADTTGDGKITRPDLIRLTQYFANWDVKLGE